jgi:hypothetical protein
MPSITAIIPTIASDMPRLTLLKRSVESALHQLNEGDELIVAGDTHNGPLDHVQQLCESLQQKEWHYDPENGKHYALPCGPTIRYVPYDDGGRASWGHSQINHAMSVAKGEWLCFNDDDDMFCAGAMQAIRDYAEALPKQAPMLFRFKSYHGPVFWVTPGLLGQGLIGGHCIVTPNVPSLLGEWAPHYEGDWSFIESTLQLWGAVGVGPVWVDRLIAIARP